MHTILLFDTLSSYPYPVIIIGCLSLFVILKYVTRYFEATRLPLPPSPRSEPFIGHLRTMPREFQWKTFMEWGNQLGEHWDISF